MDGPAFLRLPDRATLFVDREVRLRRLAVGHAMREYLLMVAEIARGQHDLLARHPAVALPTREQIADAVAHGFPPLEAVQWERDPAWRDGFRSLLLELLPRMGGSEAAHTLASMGDAEDGWLEQQAERLLTGVTAGLDLAAAPVVAAALQAYWTHLVLEVQRVHGVAGSFGRVGYAQVCPCCGTRPTAAVVRGADRYLHCALCGAEWLAAGCAHCGGTVSLHHEALEAPPGSPQPAVRAECCDDCGRYLKVVRVEDPGAADPLADDLATRALDTLAAGAGKARHGLNLMLLLADEEEDADW